jgi:hypothetical protein
VLGVDMQRRLVVVDGTLQIGCAVARRQTASDRYFKSSWWIS